jgi:hypothetical protein
MSDMSTCPDTCSFKKSGCYGLAGPVLIHWRKLSKGLKGQQWEEFCRTVKTKIRRGQIWRHNQVGDLVGDNKLIDGEALKLLVDANKGKMGYTYTHKPVIASQSENPLLQVSEETAKNNRDAIEHANKNGFTINLSADNLKQADEKAALGIAPVVVVLSHDAKETSFTPAGRKVIICPATQRENVDCANCKLCQRQRGVIIGFPAHGNAFKKVSNMVTEQNALAS